MEVIYTFNGKDITNECFNTNKSCDKNNTEKINLSFEDAMGLFYNSKTYGILQNTENAFWAESAEYIADRYFEEKKQ